ncbi:MAG: hypothetical protein QOF01_1916, partial [Thermomicrobiales bacterium]|nr:hypothetical protein [Thermomicrobiales bacterium]
YRLGGLPLAIELAAAQLRHATPQALLARMDRSLSLLTGGPEDAPERQRTMRDAIAWSVNLLRPEDRRHFQRLSVLVGEFDLSAAQAVAGGEEAVMFEAIGRLVEHSVAQHRDGADGLPRYAMLEPIRQFGRELLEADPEVEGVQRAHALHYLGVAEACRGRIEGPEGRAVLDQLEALQPNLRAALAWAIPHGEEEIAGRYVVALWKFWWVRRYVSEGRWYLEAALAMPDLRLEHRLEAHYALGGFAMGLRDLAGARRHAVAGLPLAREAGHLFWQHALLVMLGHIARAGGDSGEALARYREARPFFDAAEGHELFKRHALAMLLAGIGAAEFGRGDLDAARRATGEAQAIWRDRGDKWGQGIAALNHGAIELRANDVDAAAGHYREGIVFHRELGDKAAVAEGLGGAARVLLARGNHEGAARLFGAVEALVGTEGHPGPAMIMLDRADPLDRLREAIGADGFASAWEAGSALTMDDAIEMALEETLAPTAPASRPPPNQLGVAEPLSARELEVLRLIAEGLPDREIADALFISRRTSTTHVTHILNKLGVNSRSAAVALGMRLGLI